MRVRVFADPQPRCWSGVYRLYDAEWRLLYIGSSVNPMGRLYDHIRHKEWGATIAVMVVEWYPNERRTWTEERRAIRSSRPEHNVIRYRAAA